ncbi:hypothetical protein ACOV1W_13265 [Paraclostridium bifermentans]|uniref:hypothetical protein n=1 Tax=Paraclostridium bifermentans TaxID=1490 RepID=UPI003D2A9B4D
MDQFTWGEIFENDVLKMVLPFCIIILVTRLVPVIDKNLRTKKYTYMTKLIAYSTMATYIFAYYFKSKERLINISIMNGFTLLLCILEIVDNIISLFEEPIIHNYNKKDIYTSVSNRVRNFRYDLIQISFYINKGDLKEDIKFKIISMNNDIFEIMNDFRWIDDNIMKIESNNDHLFETIIWKILDSKAFTIVKSDDSEKVCIDKDCYDEFKVLVNEFNNVFNHYEQISNKLNKYAKLLDMIK